MNRLKPDLKRLIRWAREADDDPLESPPGFSGRVVAGWRRARVDAPLSALPGLAFRVAFAAAVVIVCGGLYLFTQVHALKPAADLSSAAQFLARNLTP